MPQYGYKFNRIAVDSTLHIPSYCGVPSITDYIKNGMIAIDTCNNVLFQWTRANGWTPISTGTYLDTTSLSNRINQRVKYTDTSAMLLPYLRKVDTVAMLSRYLRKSDTASLSNRINLKLNISDTTAMLNPYRNRVDSIYRTIGKDSIQFIINGRYRAIKDSTGVPLSRTISTTAPLTGGGDLSANRTISIPKATKTADGYLSATDWDRFRNTVVTIKPQAPLFRTRFVDIDGNTDSIYISILPATETFDGYLTSSNFKYFYNKVDTITKVGDSLIITSQNKSNQYKIGVGGSGSVTSISHGYGITNSPNPITTTGTISIDSTTLSSKYLRIADTSQMLTKYLRKSDTTSMLSKYLRAVDTTNKFVNNVIKLNDSTISVYKGTGVTNITLSPSTTVANATRLVTTVYNNSGSTIAKGSVVYINGRHSSNYPTIAKAQANTEENSYSTFAMVQDDILNNNTGTVIQAGNISNLNLPTASYTDGQLIYLSPTVAGGITTTKPLAPNHIVKIGTVTRAHPTLGSIELKIENGWQLDELSDVQIAAVPADSTILQFSRVDSLWHDVNPTTAMGNRFVRNISRVPGKDSIIFTIGSTRYAIKDSAGGGGGAAGPDNSIQFKNVEGNMSGSSNLTWYNSAQYLGIGTDNPSTTLDVRKGVLDDLPRNYEIANFTKDGEVKLGVYNSSNYDGTGSAITLGNTKNANANGGFPGFEFQNINDSANASGFIRFNYFEKDISGTIVAGSADLLTINSSGTVQINPTNYGLGAAPRLVVGELQLGDQELEVTGNSYLNGKLTTTGARNKNVIFLSDDVDGTSYYVTSTDHIIIYRTVDGNCTVNLPSSPENGRELTIKQTGDYTSFTLTVDAGAGKEIHDMGGQSGSISATINSQSITLVYYNTIWYLTAGQLE